MTTRTIRKIPTFFVIAAIGVAAWALLPALKASMAKEKHDLVVITITFDPVQRSGYAPAGRTLIDHIMFQITMGDVFFPKEFATQSPQVRTLVPQRGVNNTNTRIRVIAEQVYGKSLTCSLAYPGVRTDTQTRRGPTSVECGISVKVK